MLKGRNHILFSISIIVFLFSIVFGKSNFSQAKDNNASKPLSIIMLIDISGSMSRTDPHRLRETAAGVFIDLLSPEDYLSIVVFDDQVEIVVPLEGVDDYINKKRIKEILFPKLDPRGFTDYVGALDTVFKHLQQAGANDAQPVVIFLTDGDPNPYANSRDDLVFMKGYMEKLWDVVKGFSSERIPIHTVGFGYEIQPGVLEKISLETRGGYHILGDSGELLTTFFKLVGGLKHRQLIIDELISGGAEKEISFSIDQFTQQTNLVIATDDTDVKYSLLTPGDGLVDPAQIPGLFISEEKGNTLIVLHQLQEQYFGEWSLSVSATSSVQVLGDQDLYFKMYFEEPLPFSQQPINEPLEFRVHLNKKGLFENVLLRAEMHLSGPGIERPVFIPLEEVTEGVFSGSFDRFSRVGTYELEIRVLREGELLSSLSTSIYGKLIPSINTDFYVNQEYIVGEESIFTASLFAGGNRLTVGRDLEVEEFKVLLAFENGISEFIIFHDSGNFEEHGDFRARDGIWTNRFTIDKAGSAEVYLIASGAYRNTEFLLEKRLGDISVFKPGVIRLNAHGDLWCVPGSKTNLPIRIENDSDLKETLVIRLAGNVGSMADHKISIEPGEIRTVSLEISFDSGLSTGNYQVPLIFISERNLTVLEPDRMVVTVELLTSRAAFLKSYLKAIGMSIVLIALFIVLLLLTIAIGSFLYKMNISPQTKLKGSLFYRNSSPTNAWQEIKFMDVKDKAIITLNPRNQQADFHLKGSEYSYDMIIEVQWPGGGPRFIQGLRSLRNKYLPVKIVLRCTPPGVLEYEGKIYTEKELFHEDRFDSGDFSFHYMNPFAKWDTEKGDGVDILGGRFNNTSHEDGQSI